jgi:hypothetical protein
MTRIQALAGYGIHLLSRQARAAAKDTQHVIQHTPSRYYKTELPLQKKSRKRTHELPVTSMKHSGESAIGDQFLKDYSGSKGTDSFVGIFDALTLQSTASVTATAIVQLKARGSELCTNVAVSTRLVYDGGEVNRHESQQTRHRPRNNFSPSIRHVAPHPQSSASVKAWYIACLTKTRTSLFRKYQGRSDTSERAKKTTWRSPECSGIGHCAGRSESESTCEQRMSKF